MARNKKRLREVHFICHRGRGVRDQNDGTFLTGEWVIDPAHIYQGLVLALHETKAHRSYLQGAILKTTHIRIKPGGRNRRVELLVRKTPVSLPWKGLGSGEKGFVWS